MYLPTQEKIYREFFTRWMNDPAPAHPYMMKMRDLNLETSLIVFLGRYISPAQRQEINDGYWLITLALELVNFPFAWPGTKVYNAIKTRKMVMKYLEAASAKSKQRMSDPLAVPDCLIDEWTRAMVAAKNKAETGEVDETAKLLCREFSDHEIAQVILSFLFASQDAMSSAIVYCFQLTADHPDVLARIREEQYRVRGNDMDRPLTLEMLDEMVYTRAAVKEVMRLMPSVIMVS
jgi:C-22 sterol desaturase